MRVEVWLLLQFFGWFLLIVVGLSGILSLALAVEQSFTITRFIQQLLEISIRFSVLLIGLSITATMAQLCHTGGWFALSISGWPLSRFYLLAILFACTIIVSQALFVERGLYPWRIAPVEQQKWLPIHDEIVELRTGQVWQNGQVNRVLSQPERTRLQRTAQPFWSDGTSLRSSSHKRSQVELAKRQLRIIAGLVFAIVVIRPTKKPSVQVTWTVFWGVFWSVSQMFLFGLATINLISPFQATFISLLLVCGLIFSR